MNKIALAVMPLCLMIGCTTINQPVKEVVLAPKPVPTTAPKSVRRTPGSLWSDDSRWNEMYSLPVTRLLGDVVSIKIDEAFKAKVLAMMPPEPVAVAANALAPSDPKDPGKIQKDGKGGPDAAKPGAEGMLAAKDPADASRVSVDASKDSKSFEATIREILPRGVYGIYASQVVVVDGKTALVTLDGNVKERDVGGSDQANADSLYNLRMQVETKYSKLREEKL